MRLLAWFMGALIGGVIGAVFADLVGASGVVEIVIVVVCGLVLAALGEALVKRRQSSGQN